MPAGGCWPSASGSSISANRCGAPTQARKLQSWEFGARCHHVTGVCQSFLNSNQKDSKREGSWTWGLSLMEILATVQGAAFRALSAGWPSAALQLLVQGSLEPVTEA